MAKRMRLTLSFGRHHSRNDTKDIRQALAKRRYSIFVDECMEMPADQRKAYILKAKELQTKLNILAKGKKVEVDDTFTDGLIGALVGSGVKYFMVEGHSPEEIRLMRAAHEKRDVIIPEIFKYAVFSWRVHDAIQKTLDYLDGSAEYLRLRNNAIVRGFERMPDEIGEFFAQMDGEVHVLGRFGSHHYAILDVLNDLGMDVECDDKESGSFRGISRTLIRMTYPDITYVPSETEVAEAMFSILYKGFAEKKSEASEEMALRCLGGVEGFLRFLDDIAGTRDAGRKFKDACWTNC